MTIADVFALAGIAHLGHGLRFVFEYMKASGKPKDKQIEIRDNALDGHALLVLIQIVALLIYGVVALVMWIAS